MGNEGTSVSPRPCCHFTADERAALDSGFARILAEKEAREWEAAIREAFPVLVQAAAEAAQQGVGTDDS